MKIITWNVYFLNRRPERLLAYAISHQPDILCLQEVPERALGYLLAIPRYHMTYCPDLHSAYKGRRGYICTLTRQKPKSVQNIHYFSKSSYSLLANIVYKKIVRTYEHHRALLGTYGSATNAYTVVNFRLSCAVHPRDRIAQYVKIADHIPKNQPVLICGDFNITDSKLIQRTTGWARGYKKQDYMFSERTAFEHIFKTQGLTNIFRGTTTSIFSKPLLQFDHILIPKNTRVLSKTVSPKRYGSDHRMLYAEIVIS